MFVSGGAVHIDEQQPHALLLAEAGRPLDPMAMRTSVVWLCTSVVWYG